jgi:hypothetical protein
MTNRAEHKPTKRDADEIRVWLVIGVIFVGTMLAVSIPLIISALHA